MRRQSRLEPPGIQLHVTQRNAFSRTIRNVGQRYVQVFNSRHRRSGTLWQGRFTSCVVDSKRYPLTA